MNIGDTLRLRGHIEESDLEKAAKDKNHIVPVKNAGIREYIEGMEFKDSPNPLLPPPTRYVP